MGDITRKKPSVLEAVEGFLSSQGGLGSDDEPEVTPLDIGQTEAAVNAGVESGFVTPDRPHDPSLLDVVSTPAQGFNVGLFTQNPLNLVVDLTSFALNFGFDLVGLDSLKTNEPVGGSRNVRRALGAFNLAPKLGEPYAVPFLGHAGEVPGAAASFSIPFYGMIRGGMLAQRATATEGAKAVTQNIFADLAKAFRTKPLKFAGVETLAAGGAGFGRGLAKENLGPATSIFPGDPTAELVDELSFGFGLPVMVSQGANLTNKIYTGIRSTLPGGAKTKAGQILRDQATDPDAAITALKTGTELEGLTSAQATGDRGMLALERSLIAHSADLDGEFRALVTETSERVANNLQALGPVRPEISREFLSFRRETLLQLMQNRKSQAILTARQKISELDPGMDSATRRIEATRIADEELSLAYNAARDTEAKFWLAVDKKELTIIDVLRNGAKSGDSVIKGYKQIMAERSAKSSNPDDIPAYVHEHLANHFDPETAPLGYGNREPLGEVIDLRKRMLADIRAERTLPPGKRNNNKIRILGQLQAGALEDMSRVSRSAELGEALDMSKTINDIFTRGPIAKVLNFQPQGFERSPTGSLLDSTLGKGGRQGKDALQKMLAGLELAGRNPDAIKGAAQEFLTDAFLRQAVVDGKVNVAKAQRFFEKHGALLDEFPQLKALFSDNAKVQKFAQTAQAREQTSTRSLHDKQRSALALYIDGPPAKAISRILTARTPEQSDKLMGSLIRAVNKDASGDALTGLKGEFVDQLIAQHQLKPFSQGHDFALDGVGMTEFMRANRKAAQRLFSKEEIARIDDMTASASRIQQSFISRERADSALENIPLPLIDTAIRMAGAKFGRLMRQFLLGGRSSAGESLIASAAGSRLFQRAFEKVPAAKVETILRESIFNKELSETLLKTPRTAVEVEDLQRQMFSFIFGLIPEKAQRALGNDTPIGGGA